MKQEPDFSKKLWSEAPTIKPEETTWEKFIKFFSPQVNAVILRAVFASLALVFGGLFFNSNGKLQELRHQNTSLQNVVNRLTTEKAALENREALYSSIPLKVPIILNGLTDMISKEPTNEQTLSGILYSVIALTNQLAELTERPTFDLFINDLRVTNDISMDLRASRRLKIVVVNTSSTTAENLAVSLRAPDALRPRNLFADGWVLQPPDTTKVNNQVLVANRWEWRADRSIGSLIKWGVASLEVSTNIHAPVIGVYFDVYASHSKMNSYHVGLVFQ